MKPEAKEPLVANTAISEDLDSRFAVHFMARRNNDLLCVGAVLGIIAFVYSWCIMELGRFNIVELNLNGEPFPSGVPYMPGGVSEMIWNSQASGKDSEQGEVFYAFAMIASICQLVSWYPFFLPNVMVVGTSLFPCIQGMSWMPSMNTARALIPPIGMLLVTMCHVRPPNYENGLIGVVKIAHTGGAIAMIGGYFYFELLILAGCVRTAGPLKASEKVQRWVCLVVGLLGLLVYEICGNIDVADYGGCCMDKYVPVNMTHVRTAAKHGAYIVEAEDKRFLQLAMTHPDQEYPVYRGLYDSAIGSGLLVKKLCFYGETLAGIAALLSMLFIWHAAKELDVRAAERALLLELDA